MSALLLDSTVISGTEAARIAAEEQLHAQWQRQAARVVAAAARDVGDCRLLLEVLGLDAGVVQAARAERSMSAPVADVTATGKAAGKRTGAKRRAA